MLNQVLDYSFNFDPQTLLLLPVLIGLEVVLSADNAVALAAIAQGVEGEKQQRQALNIGLILAYVLRITLIITASWVIKYWQFELLGAAYLIWLVFNYFNSPKDDQKTHHKMGFNSLRQVIPMIAVTDLAFSLDSVTTSIAVSDQVWLILVGGTIGIIALRFLAGLFIRWLEEYTNLEDAGFITVGFVGLRLLLKVVYPTLVPPEWVMVVVIAIMFTWGFSEKTPAES